MVNTERLCLGCMNDNGGEKICPICGYNSSEGNPADCLPAKFIINGRYLVGKMINRDGECITYIGWDNSTDSIVNIKEYFPDGFAHRNPDKTVAMIEGGEYTFNEGLLEFAEINRTIQKSDLTALVEITDVFEENGTYYAIKKAISGITLGEFLDKNGGTLKWEQARALLLPLIDTVKGMNDLGIVHGGISSDTIIVGRDGKLRISAYSIKKMRIKDSELSEKLYEGYAAPEQYGIEGMHIDSYTDVYGLAATIFRVLIGTVPPEATVRMENDSMSIPARFAEELPRPILAALANGLQVQPKDRTKDVETFKNELIYGEVPNVSSKKSKGTANTKNESATQKPKKKKGSGIIAVIVSACITALVMAAIAAALIFGPFKDKLFPENSSEMPTDSSSIVIPEVDEIGDIEEGAAVDVNVHTVPDLTNMYYSEITDKSNDNDEKYEMFKIVVTDKAFSDKVAKGKVISQTVEVGTKVARGTEIGLVISLGAKEVKMPNLKGLDETNAKLEILKQGFLYENITVESIVDSEAMSGVVLKQEPEFGDTVSPEETVTIYINTYVNENEFEDETGFEGNP